MKLLERAPSLERLSQLLSEARGGSGRLLFLGGEAGVGKSSLVRAFCAALPGDVRVWTGACDALSLPRPLGPLVDVAATIGGALEQRLSRAESTHRVFPTLLEAIAAEDGPAV